MTDAAQLVRRVRPARGAARGLALVIHAEGKSIDDCVEWYGASLPEWTICAPQGTRSRNPFQTGGASAVRSSPDRYRGFAWTRRDSEQRIDLASLGDSLAELETLVLELCADSSPRPMIVIGECEGALLTRLLVTQIGPPIHLAISVASPPLGDARRVCGGKLRAPLVVFDRRPAPHALAECIETHLSSSSERRASLIRRGLPNERSI